ncbi:hypothetical protein EDB86DRAFT_1070442 [Lactarius hatsudake]|nr:hypothetical protein EDB86DRAFT_1070442 [Lactarius hatsudake]
MRKLRPRQRSHGGVPIPISHGCQSQECCIYDDSGPAVPTAATYNGYPTPSVLGNHPLSAPQSSGLQQDIHTSSQFPNTNDSDGFFPTRYYQDEPVSPHLLVIAPETLSPTGAPIPPREARSSTYESVSDSPNAVANEPIADPVSDVIEDRFPHAEWMCAPPNTARSLNVDRYSSSSHTTLTLYDSQNITSDVLDMSGDAHTFNPQLHSTRSPNHPSTSPRSPGNFSDFLTWDRSHLGQESEAAFVELSPAIWFSIEAPPVPPAVPRKESRCVLCGIRFAQSQVLNRHMKDKHEDKGSCPHCSNFRWSRGRPYLYTRHLQAKHSGLASFEDPPGGTRKAQVLRARARQRKVPSREGQVTFREPLIPFLGDRLAHK